MDDLARFCCQNSRCSDFGRHDAGNLTVTGRLGKFRQYRLLYCRACRSRFSERKGTPLYRAHLPEDKVLSILDRSSPVANLTPLRTTGSDDAREELAQA